MVQARQLAPVTLDRLRSFVLDDGTVDPEESVKVARSTLRLGKVRREDRVSEVETDEEDAGVARVGLGARVLVGDLGGRGGGRDGGAGGGEKAVVGRKEETGEEGGEEGPGEEGEEVRRGDAAGHLWVREENGVSGSSHNRVRGRFGSEAFEDRKSVV